MLTVCPPCEPYTLIYQLSLCINFAAKPKLTDLGNEEKKMEIGRFFFFLPTPPQKKKICMNLFLLLIILPSFIYLDMQNIPFVFVFLLFSFLSKTSFASLLSFYEFGWFSFQIAGRTEKAPLFFWFLIVFRPFLTYLYFLFCPNCQWWTSLHSNLPSFSVLSMCVFDLYLYLYDIFSPFFLFPFFYFFFNCKFSMSKVSSSLTLSLVVMGIFFLKKINIDYNKTISFLFF